MPDLIVSLVKLLIERQDSIMSRLSIVEGQEVASAQADNSLKAEIQTLMDQIQSVAPATPTPAA